MGAVLQSRPALKPRALALLALAVSLPWMTGCLSLFTSKRSLPIPEAPSIVQTASADELVKRLNEQWDKFESLTAAVDIRASHLKTTEATATDYPSFRANVLLRKPEMIRILGKAPVVQTTMFDLASDGTRFVLVVPPKSKAYEGLNNAKGTSPNWYENLRPGFLFSALVVRGLEKSEQSFVIAETMNVPDIAKKRMVARPDYVLTIVRVKPDSSRLYPVRVVRFHRDDLLPYQQDLYDDQGNLQTQVIYGPYRNFEGTKYPGTITLRRPQEEYELVMSVERITANPPLTDDMFQVKIPPDYTLQQLK